MPDPLRPILLLTRPADASRGLLEQCQARGLDVEPVISPLIGIEPVADLPQMPAGAVLVFTSANGVRSYQALGGRCAGLAYVVGAATGRAARQAGFDVISADGNADDLVALICAQVPRAPLVHLRGAHTRGNVVARLQAQGFAASEQIIYNQPELPLTAQAQAAISGKTPIIAPIYSPRTGQILAQHTVKAPLLVAALSEAVAKSCASLHKTDLRIAQRPDSGSLIRVIEGLFNQAQMEESRSLRDQGGHNG